MVGVLQGVNVEALVVSNCRFFRIAIGKPGLMYKYIFMRLTSENVKKIRPGGITCRSVCNNNSFEISIWPIG